MRRPHVPGSSGWFAKLSPARRGWVLFAGGLLVTGLLASAGITSTLLAALLAVVMGAGLVLGLSPILSAGASAAADTPGRKLRAVPALAPARAGTRGLRPVPPSWEYYETFGR
ncbi:hypothetical protein [Georgenia daeguensis]|uniref:DUF3040 domain-containing protein n=1 Tax=Georgenia daeguensis TaxID=908355 RepID=A0ABP8EU47_9MICO